MPEFIYKQKNLRNVVDLEIPLTIEMPKSMWSEEFRFYSVKDLCGNGLLYENPHTIKSLTQKQIKQIKNSYYRVYPFDVRKFVKNQKLLKGYLYVGDISNSMYIEHEELND